MASQLKAFKKEVDGRMEAGSPMEIAVMDSLKPLISSVIDSVCFDGNGYSDEWKEEAEKRGLDVETSVPKMFTRFTLPQSIEMFTSTGVYSEKELVARNEVKLETYIKKVQIEARVMGRMAINHVIPAAIQYETSLLKEIALRKDIFGEVIKKGGKHKISFADNALFSYKTNVNNIENKLDNIVEVIDVESYKEENKLNVYKSNGKISLEDAFCCSSCYII